MGSDESGADLGKLLNFMFIIDYNERDGEREEYAGGKCPLWDGFG